MPLQNSRIMFLKVPGVGESRGQSSVSNSLSKPKREFCGDMGWDMRYSSVQLQSTVS